MEDTTKRGKLEFSAYKELKGGLSLENVAKVFKYTKECTLLNRQNKANYTWSKCENDKTAQEETMKHVLEDDEEDL